MSVVVQLSKFEGPLALLLYLIRKDEMDIFDIKINEITTQYLDYIKLMKELDLEVAGEFVAMAATLIQIKSKMLLPQYDEKGEVIENEDPRKELVQKLLEYQKYQEAARLLYERPLVGRDMWTRGVRLNLDEPTEEIEVEENGLFTMISLYRQIMRSAKKRIHQVTAKAQSIASRILEIKDKLTMGSRKTLNELIDVSENHVRQVLITFLSVLELAKLGFVGLYQTETYGDIWIDLKKPIEKDVVSAVEEYESIDNNADKLFAMEAPKTTEDVGAEGDDFVLVDAEDNLEEAETEQLSLEDIATDDEILQAEMELDATENGIEVTENLQLPEAAAETEIVSESVLMEFVASDDSVISEDVDVLVTQSSEVLEVSLDLKEEEGAILDVPSEEFLLVDANVESKSESEAELPEDVVAELVEYQQEVQLVADTVSETESAIENDDDQKYEPEMNV